MTVLKTFYKECTLIHRKFLLLNTRIRRNIDEKSDEKTFAKLRNTIMI